MRPAEQTPPFSSQPTLRRRQPRGRRRYPKDIQGLEWGRRRQSKGWWVQKEGNPSKSILFVEAVAVVVVAVAVAVAAAVLCCAVAVDVDVAVVVVVVVCLFLIFNIL